MKKTLKFLVDGISLFFLLLLVGGCSSTQKVIYTPPPTTYASITDINYANGFPQQSQPWVVFSDRVQNRVLQTERENLFSLYNDASFLAPFIVLKKNKKMYKIAEYKKGLINEGKRPSAKELKVLGWIPEERLLLWSNSLKNELTGFSTKAALVVNDAAVINQADKYIENDSVLIYLDPELVTKAPVKVPIGSFVYIYKYAADMEKVLIGRMPGTVVDAVPSNIYGWVSKNMLSFWGERTSLKIKDNAGNLGMSAAADLLHEYAITPQELSYRKDIEAIYPLSSANQVKYFTNVLNYDDNRVYNVLGDPIYYNRFRTILKDNKKLNIVFVLDASKNNRLYFPLVKSLLQELQLNFINPSYFSTIKFGGVVYKQNNCAIHPLYSSLSSNYNDITAFFDHKIAQMNCADNGVEQPVDQGLLAATKLLSEVPNETNIIILIGTTATESVQRQSVINALSRTNAKLVFFQTQSKSADAYTDFVLLGQKVVTNSAMNISERKKHKIVNQNDLLTEVDFSLTAGENGVYFLNYPKQSMSQGFVLFPKKGEAMAAGLLKTAIDSLLLQVTADNKQIDASLTKYFRSDIGVSTTRLAAPYQQVFPLGDRLIPTGIAADLLNHTHSFLVKGKFSGVPDSILAAHLTYGVLLDEQEYEQLRGYYSSVYKAVFAKPKFNKLDALNHFLQITSENIATPKKMERGKLIKMPMHELLTRATGFSVANSIYMDMSAQKWIRDKALKPDKVMIFFEQFGNIVLKMGNSKRDKAIRIEHEGQVFYWLDDSFLPKINSLPVANK